jgi:Helix-turn-helix domain
MNAQKEIEKHLLAGNSITPLEALQMFGCFRLGAVIYRLRKKYDIDTEEVPNPKSPEHTFARYRMTPGKSPS